MTHVKPLQAGQSSQGTSEPITGGPFDIWPFFAQLPILFNYIYTYGFWGACYKTGSGHLDEVCGQYPGWAQVGGHIDIWHIFTQLPILYTYVRIVRHMCFGAPL